MVNYPLNPPTSRSHYLDKTSLWFFLSNDLRSSCKGAEVWWVGIEDTSSFFFLHEEVTHVDEEGIKNWAPYVENLLAFWYEVPSCNFLYKKNPKKIGPLCLKTFWHFCITKLPFFQKKKILI
jgi:hypothetical protein